MVAGIERVSFLQMCGYWEVDCAPRGSQKMTLVYTEVSILTLSFNGVIYSNTGIS